MKLVKTLFVLAMLALLAVPAAAATRAGVRMPDRIQVEGKTLVLNGMGVREATIFNVDVYVAGLYLESRSHDAGHIIRSEQVKLITLHFVRDVDRSDIVDAWKEGFEKNAGKHLPALKARVARLNSWMTDMKDGQSLSFTYVPGKGVTVNVKGRVRGVIRGADFGRVLFAIWLGPHPPNKGLKAGLLGVG